MTNVHSQLGEQDEAVVTGARALEIARRLGDVRLRILTTTYLAQAHYYRGEYERVVELATDNLAVLRADWLYERFGLPSPASIYDRWLLVQSLAELGRFAEAAKDEAEAIRLAEPTQHAFTIGESYFAAGALRLLRGDWMEARSLLEHASDGVSERERRPRAAPRARRICLGARAARRDGRRAQASSGKPSSSSSATRRGEWSFSRGRAYGLLGRACLGLGRLADVQGLAERALDSSPPRPGFAIDARHLLGDVASHPDRFDPASGEAHYRQALALAEPRGMRPLVAHCHLGLGKLYRRTGEREQAQEHLTIAAAMYREMDMGFWLAKADAAGAEGDS